MKIEHIAIWCKDLEKMKDFYVRFFDATANTRYHNPKNRFYSYFLCFETGARLELMQMPGIPDHTNNVMAQFTGLIHFAMSVGSEEKVNMLTEQLRKEGIRIVGEPRKTGDGYYESAILDIEGNRIEITV
jgi:lactoylglutathione lyase